MKFCCIVFTLLIVNVALLLPNVYPEHREITVRGINKLTESEKASLSNYWSDARIGFESRLSELVIDTNLNANTTTIDLAAWPAIGGDHTCSPDALINTILHTNWIVNVNQIAAELGVNLAESGENSYKRNNALRVSDSKFLFTDPEYATRAGSNNVHFLLPNPHPESTLDEYLKICLDINSESNGIASYSFFHYLALQAAMDMNNGVSGIENKSETIRKILAYESFALHFLQDAFAAGHIAGSWGATSLRKGTHDYYNEKG